MTQRFNIRKTYPISREKLFEWFTDPKYHEEKSLYSGSLSAVCTRTVEADGTIVIKLMESMKPFFGKGPEKGTYTGRWNPKSFTENWTYVPQGQEERVKAAGSSQIVALSDGECAQISMGEIEIKVPLIGGLIEKKVSKMIEEGIHKEEEFIRMRIQKG